MRPELGIVHAHRLIEHPELGGAELFKTVEQFFFQNIVFVQLKILMVRHMMNARIDRQGCFGAFGGRLARISQGKLFFPELGIASPQLAKARPMDKYFA